MSDYIVSKNIDYITITSDDTMPEWVFGNNLTRLDRSPNRNYNVAHIGDNGAIKMFHSDQETVGTHWILSGETLGVLRGEGHGDIDVINQVKSMSGKVTRIDIAVTVGMNDGSEIDLTPNWLNELALTENMVSRLKLDNGVALPDMDIGTCYIGSRKSRNRLLRIYDKGVQLDLEKYRITRIELETRKNPDVIVRALAKNEDIGAIIRRYVDFPTVKQWVDIMAQETAVMPQVENNMTLAEKRQKEKADRWHWLLTSVAPAMAKALYFDYCDPELNDNLRLFNIHVHNILQDMIEESDKKS